MAGGGFIYVGRSRLRRRFRRKRKPKQNGHKCPKNKAKNGGSPKPAVKNNLPTKQDVKHERVTLAPLITEVTQFCRFCEDYSLHEYDACSSASSSDSEDVIPLIAPLSASISYTADPTSQFGLVIAEADSVISLCSVGLDSEDEEDLPIPAYKKNAEVVLDVAKLKKTDEELIKKVDEDEEDKTSVTDSGVDSQAEDEVKSEVDDVDEDSSLLEESDEDLTEEVEYFSAKPRRVCIKKNRFSMLCKKGVKPRVPEGLGCCVIL